MSYTKDQMIDEMNSIDAHEEDRLIDEARRAVYLEADYEPEVANMLGGKVVSVEDVTYDENALYTPTIEQRKHALVERVKDIAPDWDEMTTRELLHCMAAAKVTFWADAEMYVRTAGDA